MALVIVMVVLVIAYALAQSAMLFGRKRQMRTQEARDRLWNLLHPILAPSHAQARCAPAPPPLLPPQGSQAPLPDAGPASASGTLQRLS